MRRIVFIALVLVFISLQAYAHCDSVAGPVITDAKAALAKGDVTPVLKWIAPAKEGEIRSLFKTTLKVRQVSPEARDLVDRHFFETLVRIHREGEGEPFTGLKPEGYKVEEGIEAADLAIDKGSLDTAEAMLLKDVQSGLRKRFAEVMEARKHASDSVEAGRHYVAAYVAFIHYAERLHQVAGGPSTHTAEATPTAHAH